MTISITSPYTFAIIDAGEKFPAVLVQSGESQTELSGYYSLRQLGLDPAGEGRSRDPLFFELLFPKQLRKDTWIIDSWLSKAAFANREVRRRNLALVVRGLPHPTKLGMRGRSVFQALEQQMGALADAFSEDDSRAIEFNIGLVTAILGELDRITRLRERMSRVFLYAMMIYVIVFSILVAGATVSDPLFKSSFFFSKSLFSSKQGVAKGNCEGGRQPSQDGR